MKAKKLLPVLLSATAFTIGLSGCSDYDNDYTDTDILYAHNFEQMFGKVDPNQDWNLLAQLANAPEKATRASESTTTPAGEFKITVLPETQAAPLTTEKMKAYSKMLPESNLGGAPYDKTNLGRVTQNFSAMTKRIVLYPVYWWTSAIDDIGLYYYADGDKSEEVTLSDGTKTRIVRVSITDSKPEELECKYTAEPTLDRFYNYNDFDKYVTAEYKQYLADNNSEYVICDGSQYGSGGYVPYNFTNGTLLEYKGQTSLGHDTDAASANTPFDYYDVATPLNVVEKLAAAFPKKFKCVANDEYYFISSEGGDTWIPVSTVLSQYGDQTKVDPVITAADEGTHVTKTNITPTGFRSKGILVDLPATMKIGFYIQNGSDIMYSEGKLNHKMSWTGHTDEDACYIATYKSEETDAEGKPVRYLAFEDWYNAGDYDLNDIVFRVYGIDDETIIDNDNEVIREEGLFVCEDLGNFDFDFNDIVLKALWRRYYKREYTKDSNGKVISVTVAQEPSDDLTITAMAAGGANPSEVYFKTASNSTGQILGEIHELLNGLAPSIINAGSKFGKEGQSFRFEEAQFPSTWNKTAYPTGYVSQMFAEGSLYVIASTTNSVPDQDENEDYNHNAEHLITSDGYKSHGVPQMMLLPMYYEWCQESKPIEDVYPNFKSWVNDATRTDWITNGKVESLTTDRGVTPEMYAKNTSPSSDPVTPPVTPPAQDYGDDISEYIGETLPASLFENATSAVITILGGSYTQTDWYTPSYGWTWNNSYGSIAEGVYFEKELDSEVIGKINSEGGLKLGDWGNHPAKLWLKVNK